MLSPLVIFFLRTTHWFPHFINMSLICLYFLVTHCVLIIIILNSTSDISQISFIQDLILENSFVFLEASYYFASSCLICPHLDTYTSSMIVPSLWSRICWKRVYVLDGMQAIIWLVALVLGLGEPRSVVSEWVLQRQLCPQATHFTAFYKNRNVALRHISVHRNSGISYPGYWWFGPCSWCWGKKRWLFRRPTVIFSSKIYNLSVIKRKYQTTQAEEYLSNMSDSLQTKKLWKAYHRSEN